MRSISRIPILISVVALYSVAAGGDSVADLPGKAIEQSQITLPGSRPFILKARVLEETNPANTNYDAEIEEYWVAPDKWRRTVRTTGFSQTLVVNGEKTGEQLTGDYYPNWLRTIVAAIFEPGNALQGIDMSQSSDNPVMGGVKVCRRFTYMAGIAPVSNKVFYSFCFQGGLLESVVIPGYEVSYRTYKDFAGKRVAHAIREEVEPGTELLATITDLRELANIDEAQFAIQETSTPLQTVEMSEEVLRSLATTAPEIVWPTVRSGADKGTLSLYVCLDRSGHVREIYELNSSNAGLSDVARDQVMKWQFKSAVQQGVPVQVESMLTFAFQTAVADPIPVLDEDEGGKYILHRVDPKWPHRFAPPGTPVIVTIGISETGAYKSLVFVTSDDAHRALVMNQFGRIEGPLKHALERWKFQPYMRNGKATEYQLKVTFWINGKPESPVT
jgi:hypothetical protein